MGGGDGDCLGVESGWKGDNGGGREAIPARGGWELRADMWVVILGGAEIDFVGVFWGVCAFFGGGWYGYTGKSFLPLYGH